MRKSIACFNSASACAWPAPLARGSPVEARAPRARAPRPSVKAEGGGHASVGRRAPCVALGAPPRPGRRPRAAARRRAERRAGGSHPAAAAAKAAGRAAERRRAQRRGGRDVALPRIVRLRALGDLLFEDLLLGRQPRRGRGARLALALARRWRRRRVGGRGARLALGLGARRRRRRRRRGRARAGAGAAACAAAARAAGGSGGAALGPPPRREPCGCSSSGRAPPRRVAFGPPPLLCSITQGLLSRRPGQPQQQQQQQPKGGSGGGGGKGRGGKGQEEDERILISEIEVIGVDGELKRVAQEALTARPNFAYTLKEVEADLRRVFATGWFSSCVPDAEDTRDGVKLIVKVTPNPELRGIVARGGDTLPTRIVQDAFRGLAGSTLNFVRFGRAVERIDGWYRKRGILGQVVDFTFEGGVAELCIGEASVGDIRLQFADSKTGATKEQGATRPDVVLRHLTMQPGRVYSLRQARADIDSIYSTGLYEDVNITPQEAEDSTEENPKVDLTINLVERKTGGLGAGTGISAQARGEGSMPGFVGNFTYSQRNLFGLNQKLSALVELGAADTLVRLQHVDPWVLGDQHRTSRTISVMNTRAPGGAIHGRAENDTAPAADGEGGGASGAVQLGRLVAGAEWRRPLAADWSGSVGFTWQRNKCMDDKGTPLQSDCYGAPLTFSGSSTDTVALTNIGLAYSSSKDGSQLGGSLEQAAPLARDWLSFSRLRLRAEQPVSLGPLTLALRGRAGSLWGDLPPYEAFPIGGANSVRGYAEGGVGSARAFLEGSAELRWTIHKPVQGTLFADYGTDLDSGESVIGDPAGARGKPGSGYGYGAGIRVDSPLGPLRLEYAWNDARRGRFHVALGYD
ncbi:MAG: surface antigen-domain-containing protein [Monoraphidium minutum]|nr:MAG: surface antigen-domain-containing protein [Monoraphidium minutum]